MLVNGLAEEIIGAAHDPLNAIVSARQPRNQDDWYEASLRLGLDGETCRKPGLARHHHVEQRQIHRLLMEGSQCPFAVLRADNAVAFRSQESREEVTIRLVIISDQNGGLVT